MATPGPREGGVTIPYSRSIASTTLASLLHGMGGFNHLGESLNPFIHLGGPCRGCPFRCRLRSPVALAAWMGPRAQGHRGDVVHVCLRLWICHSAATLTLRETSAMPCRSGYADTSSSGLFLGLGLVPTADSPNLGPWRPSCYVNVSFYLNPGFTWYSCPSQLQRLGTTPMLITAGNGRQAWLLRGAWGVLITDINPISFHDVDLCLGDTGPGPGLKFPSSPLESLMDVLPASLEYGQLFSSSDASLTASFKFSMFSLSSRCHHSLWHCHLLHHRHRHHHYVVIVHPLFMWNTYLSLYMWFDLLLSKN
jgi:hypothetical protein